MLSCARGAISRALRLHALPSGSRLSTCRLSRGIHDQLSAQWSITTTAKRQRRIPRRNFSTSPFQQHNSNPEILAEVFPICCPGCGAFSQTIEPDEPGYYNLERKQIQKLLASKRNVIKRENATGEAVTTGDSGNIDITESLQQQDAVVEERTAPQPNQDVGLPDHAVISSSFSPGPSTRISHVCNRCHDLIHHNKAVSYPKPSIDSIQEYLSDSPYKNNRVYHILDAADFPMSLVPRIHWALKAQEQRSRNRRSATEKYHRGGKLPTLSFIITRSDLLAATKEQVDSKMQYVRSVLRHAMGRVAKDTRLGNVHMISAHRGWWTKQVKEEIREHGGGIWVVGKTNVGKSSFIEACFPKDSRSPENMAEWIDQRRVEDEILNQRQTSFWDPDSILPPPPREDMFPVLPVVSSLPGTTVSPIRIPFGRGKGEVIDLPGLERGQLEDFVRDEHKRDLIMTKRIKPERCTIKPGQSLLLGGGLVRITPVNPEDTVLAACFIPLQSHLTNTEKAIEMQTEKRPCPGTVLMVEGTGETISSAGKYGIKWDVTRSHLPSSIAKVVHDQKIPIPPLPYRVMSADILIEGCGWVEISVQVRAKRTSETDSPSHPQVEVFTPNGKHIASRPPIECWKFIEEKRKVDKRKRPRLRHRYS